MKKLSSRTKKQGKMSLKEASILPSFHFKIAPIPAGFICVIPSQGLCLYEVPVCDQNVWQKPLRRLHICSSAPASEVFGVPKGRTCSQTQSSCTPKGAAVCCNASWGTAASQAHQALLGSFHDCRMAQSIYLQTAGITRLDKSITTMGNLWTLAWGFCFPFCREHAVFHCLLYFFLLHCSCAQYPTQIDFPGGTNKQIESRGGLNKGNHCKWSLN